MKLNAKKGFAFTMTMMVVLFFMVTAITLWAQANEQKESRIANKMQYYVLAQGMRVMNEEVVNDFANKSAYYGLYKLSNFTIQNKLKSNDDLPYEMGGSLDHEKVSNVNESMYTIIVNGTADDGLFDGPNDLEYSDDEKGMYTFSNFTAKINKSCTALGMTCNLSQPYNFSFIQTSPWEVQLYFEVNASVDAGTAGVEDTVYIVNQSFNIKGFQDPMVSKLMQDYNGTDVSKQMFPYKDDFNATTDDVGIHELSPFDPFGTATTKGKGFFYGPIVELDDVNLTSNNTWKHILKADADEIYNHPNKTDIMNKYGAFLIERAEVDTTSGDEYESSSETVTIDLGPTGANVCPAGDTLNRDFYCRMYAEKSSMEEPNCVIDCINSTGTITNRERDFDIASGDYGDPHRSIGGVPCPSGGGMYTISANLLNYINDPLISDKDDICNWSVFTDVDSTNITEARDKPYIVTTSTFMVSPNGPDNYPFAELEPVENNSRYLIDNEFNVSTSNGPVIDPDIVSMLLDSGYHKYWNIEGLREMGMCEAYVKPENYPWAPSFFQRMVDDGHDLSDEELGLETFVIGKWSDRPYSKVGWEYLQDVDLEEGNYVKGMPGNKMQMQTSISTAIGHFGMSNYTMDRYIDVKKIICREGASCE